MKRLAASATLLAGLLLGASAAHAHPMGIRLWGHRMTVTAGPDAVRVDYVIEVPLSKLVLMMNRYRSVHNLDTVGPAEEKAFEDELIGRLTAGIGLTVDGQRAALAWNPNYARRSGSVEPGFFEYRVDLIAPLETGPGARHRIEVANDNYPLQRAVFHNEIHVLPGVHAVEATVSPVMRWEEDESNRKIAFDLLPGDAPEGAAAVSSKGDGTRGASDGRLLSLLRRGEGGAGFLLIAFGTALLLGALHALSPGHGKALVAAYLVGSRGGVRHAVLLGALVTLTHISSVVVLGIAGFLAARYIVPEYYAPFISLASGLMIVGIGLWLFVRRLAHDHAHRHGEHGHGHARAPGPDAPPSWRALAAMGVSGGIVPCPSAMAVMLTAIAIGRAGLGLAIIAFFSVGLAVVLTAIGILTVKASKLMERLPGQPVFSRWLPVASAAVVTVLGIIIIYQGFWRPWTELR